MYKKRLKYTDFNGEEREEDFYFNLTQAEIVEMDFSEKGGLDQYISKIRDEKDSKKLIQLFKEILIKSYGVKSPDGKRFIKNDEVRDEFLQTQAYSDYFIMLASDANEAAAFIKGISPVGISDTDLVKAGFTV